MTRRALLALPFVVPAARAVEPELKVWFSPSRPLSELPSVPLSALELFGVKTGAIVRVSPAPLAKEHGKMLEAYLRARL